MPGALKNRKLRGWIIQAVVLLICVGLTVSFVLIARRNLLSQGIATGFGFLDRTTGWPINFSLTGVTANSTYGQMLVAGLLNTLLVGGLALTSATVVGVVVGLMRTSRNLILNVIGTVYVEIFRNVPLILQAFFWYAVLTHLPLPRQALSLGGAVFLSNRGLMLPSLGIDRLHLLLFLVAASAILVLARRLRRRETPAARRVWPLAALAIAGLLVVALLSGGSGHSLVELPHLQGLRFVGGMTLKPEFAALWIAMTVFGGAYIGEIVRGGFLSVDKGQIEAARALGLDGFFINRFVRIPLAVRAMLPALANQYVWLMKATTLGIVIGYPDYFMVVSISINQSGQTIELLALLMGGFLLINYAIGGAMNRLNNHLAIKGKG